MKWSVAPAIALIVMLASVLWMGRRNQPITKSSVPLLPTAETQRIEQDLSQIAEARAGVMRGSDNFMVRIESERNYRPLRAGKISELINSNKWERFGIR